MSSEDTKNSLVLSSQPSDQEMTTINIEDDSHSSGGGGMINLTIRTLPGQMIPITVPAGATTTVLSVRQAVTAKEGITAANQRLIFGGRELQDTDVLSERGIYDGYTIHLLIKTTAQALSSGGAGAANNAGAGAGVGGGGEGGGGVHIPVGVAHIPNDMIMGQNPDVAVDATRQLETYVAARGVKWFSILDMVTLSLSLFFFLDISFLLDSIVNNKQQYNNFSLCYDGMYVFMYSFFCSYLTMFPKL